MIEFVIPGTPVAKARPRMTRHGHVYTPAKTKAAEERIRNLAIDAMDYREPVADPISINIVFGMPIPKSWTKAKRLEALTLERFPTSRPDIDNLIKTVCDACNAVVWEDDAQIVQLWCSKIYVPEGCAETQVEVSW